MKLCFIDTETSGTDPEKHGLVQFAGKLRIGAVEKNFKFRVRIFPQDEVVAEAVRIHGLEPTEGCDPIKAHRDFVNMLGNYCDRYDKRDKFFFVGYNAEFDSKFLRKFFEKCGDKYFGSWFWFPYLDVMTLALTKLMHRRPGMENFKLVSVCRALGIDFDMERAHGAEYDIEKTIELCDKLQLFPNLAKGEKGA